jgi:hypothetical protein
MGTAERAAKRGRFSVDRVDVARAALRHSKALADDAIPDRIPIKTIKIDRPRRQFGR